jgi:hypothetical protein
MKLKILYRGTLIFKTHASIKKMKPKLGKEWKRAYYSKDKKTGEKFLAYFCSGIGGQALHNLLNGLDNLNIARGSSGIIYRVGGVYEYRMNAMYLPADENKFRMAVAHMPADDIEIMNEQLISHLKCADIPSSTRGIAELLEHPYIEINPNQFNLKLERAI